MSESSVCMRQGARGVAAMAALLLWLGACRAQHTDVTHAPAATGSGHASRYSKAQHDPKEYPVCCGNS